jgi:hypothetical protein
MIHVFFSILQAQKHTLTPSFILDTYTLSPLLLSKLLVELVVNLVVATEAVLIMYWAAEWKGNFGMIVLSVFLLFESFAR